MNMFIFLTFNNSNYVEIKKYYGNQIYLKNQKTMPIHNGVFFLSGTLSMHWKHVAHIVIGYFNDKWA